MAHPDPEVLSAFNDLNQALHQDPNYAHAWHCNVAMSCYDAICEESELLSHERALNISNKAASLFMKLAFNVVTGQEPTRAMSETMEASEEEAPHGPERKEKPYILDEDPRYPGI